MRDKPTKAWICTICGYIHYGDEPPAECPLCGADRDLFEAYYETAVTAVTAGAVTRRIVIVGAGIAGVAAAEAARNTDPAAEITLLSSEPGLPYYRMSLTRYLAGEIGGDLLDLHPQAWYSERRILLLSDCTVQSIDLDGRAVVLADNSRLSFDRLVLAAGARPFVPPISGADLGFATTLRTRADAAAILEACAVTRPGGEKTRVVCIGGGILGLETAGALARRQAAVTVLENQPWLLARQLNRTAGRVFQEHLKGLGIAVVTQARTTAIRAEGLVALDGADLLPADLVVISAGVRANTDLARSAGLQVNQGVVVDECMQTSHPDVFAAGDIAEHAGMLYGLWAPSQMQGTVAGTAAAGGEARFTGVPRSTTLKVLGIDLFSIGPVNEPEARLIDEEAAGCYTAFYFQDGKMSAAILLSDAGPAAMVKKAVEERVDFSALLADNPNAAQIKAALASY